MKTESTLQVSTNHKLLFKTSKKSPTDAERLCVASGNLMAAYREEARATRELANPPKESLEEVMARLHAKCKKHWEGQRDAEQN